MHLRNIVVLAAAILASTVDGAPTFAEMTAPNLPYVARSFAAAQHDIPVKRTLRVDNTEEEGDERGFGDSIAGAITSGVSKVKMKLKLREMLANKQSADDALVYLKLDGGVDNILSNPNLKKLIKYVARYNRKFPDSEVSVVGTLTTKYGTNVVAGILEDGMKSPSTMAMADKLRGQLYSSWNNAGMSYGQVFRELKLHQADNPLKGNVYESWRSYFDMYNKRATTKTTEYEALRKILGDRGFAGTLLRTKDQFGTDLSRLEFQRNLYDSWVRREVNPGQLKTRVFKLQPNEQMTGIDKNVLSDYTLWWKTAKNIK